MHADLKRVRAALRAASSVTVIVGPQLSAEAWPSPEDTVDSEWDAFEPSDIATPEEFRQAPERVWRWYMKRRARVVRRSALPEVQALYQVLARVPRAQIITGNADGYLERSGAPSRPLELHGSIWRTRCMGCGRVRPDPRISHDELPPRCGHCSAVLRPDVVWFGEALNASVLEQAVRVSCLADVMLLVGVRANEQPAAGLVAFACENNAVVVEVAERAAVEGLCGVAFPGPIEDSLRRISSALHQADPDEA